MTGIPDFFSYIGPFVRSVLPFRALKKGKTLPALKPWAKSVFALYIIITVPLLLFLILVMLKNVPHILATAWESFNKQRLAFGDALGKGQALNVLFAAVQMLLLALPIAGLCFTLFTLGKGLMTRLWAWAQPSGGRHVVAAAVTAAFAALLLFFWVPGIPSFQTQAKGNPAPAPMPQNNWQPIATAERGTVFDAAPAFVPDPYRAPEEVPATVATTRAPASIATNAPASASANVTTTAAAGNGTPGAVTSTPDSATTTTTAAAGTGTPDAATSTANAATGTAGAGTGSSNAATSTADVATNAAASATAAPPASVIASAVRASTPFVAPTATPAPVSTAGVSRAPTTASGTRIAGTPAATAPVNVTVVGSTVSASTAASGTGTTTGATATSSTTGTRTTVGGTVPAAVTTVPTAVGGTTGTAVPVAATAASAVIPAGTQPVQAAVTVTPPR